MGSFVLLIAFFTLLGFSAGFYDPKCPSSFSLALGSYTNHAWFLESRGEGVYIVDYDNDELSLSHVLDTSFTNENPSYVAVKRPFLYVANENFSPTFRYNGSVTRVLLSKSRQPISSTFANATGFFTTYVAVHPGNIVLGANFLSSFDTYISRGDEFIRADSFTVPAELASEVATNMTLGPMFGQPHPHIVLPYGEGVVVCDAGSNLVWYFSLNRRTGKLALINRVPFRITDGPRHAVQHTRSKTLYVLNEVSVSLAVLKPSKEGLSLRYMIDVLDETPDEVSLAAIRTTRDGRFLYVSVRYPGTTDGAIVGYKLHPRTGDILYKIGMWSTFGVHPRDFNLIESARFRGKCTSFVAAVHRDSDSLVLIERNRISGMLSSYPAVSLNVSTPTSVIPLW